MKELNIIVNYNIKYDSKSIYIEEELSLICNYNGVYTDHKVIGLLDIFSDKKNFSLISENKISEDVGSVKRYKTIDAFGNKSSSNIKKNEVEKKYDRFENRTLICRIEFDESLLKNITEKLEIVQFIQETGTPLPIFDRDKIGLIETVKIFEEDDLEKYEEFLKNEEKNPLKTKDKKIKSKIMKTDFWADEQRKEQSSGSGCMVIFLLLSSSFFTMIFLILK